MTDPIPFARLRYIYQSMAICSERPTMWAAISRQSIHALTEPVEDRAALWCLVGLFYVLSLGSPEPT